MKKKYTFEQYLKDVKYSVDTLGDAVEIGTPMVFYNLCKELLEWQEKYGIILLDTKVVEE